MRPHMTLTLKCPPRTISSRRGVEIPNDGGIEVDSQGVVWTNWRSSDHVMAFDRRKCKVLSGPNATGVHYAEGWTLYRTSGPTLQGSTANADMNYLLSDASGMRSLGREGRSATLRPYAPESLM